MSPKIIRDQSFLTQMLKRTIPDKLILKRFKYKSPDHNLYVHKLKIILQLEAIISTKNSCLE
jgi:hypothetical protein